MKVAYTTCMHVFMHSDNCGSKKREDILKIYLAIGHLYGTYRTCILSVKYEHDLHVRAHVVILAKHIPIDR